MNNDTIFALSSGHGKSGVAVIRISGEKLSDIFERFINKPNISPRHAYFINLFDNAGEIIDQCLAIYFPGPHSFTGEDVIELHTHGAPACRDRFQTDIRRGRRTSVRCRNWCGCLPAGQAPALPAF